MKYTLLELVQRILDSMESDEVSSIGETPESYSVANIVKECFYDIVGQSNFAEHEGLFKLDASTNLAKPTLMTIPNNVVKIDWLKYNRGTYSLPEYKILMYIQPEEFLELNARQDDSTPIQSYEQEINGTTFVFKARRDRLPTYYTIFDDRYVVFDSYDVEEEATLTQVRSLGSGLLSPDFQMVDTFVPDLDHRQFQLLLQDAKSTAHIELKQQANQKAEQKYRRNFILSQKTKNDNDPDSSRQKAYLFGRRRPYGKLRFTGR